MKMVGLDRKAGLDPPYFIERQHVVGVEIGFADEPHHDA